jgi:thiol-disulfide isomerase/thioredoxin
VTEKRPLVAGASAPGLDTPDPAAVLFYKVTCPTCQMAAPVMERLHAAFPERIVAVVQDPPDAAERFAGEYGLTFGSRPDAPPYPLSDAWGVRVVPTLFVVAAGTVDRVVESWDREGWNDAAGRLAELTGVEPPQLSHPSDGLPPFRPG